MPGLSIINGVLLVLGDAFFGLLLVSSIKERETRAAWLSFFLMLGNTGLWFGLTWMRGYLPVYILNLGLLIVLLAAIPISLARFFPAREASDLSGIDRYDERDNMFARNNLAFHPHLAARYYQSHPEKQEIDRKIQEKPRLGEPGHIFYDAYYSPVFTAAFQYLDQTRSAAGGEKGKSCTDLDPGKLSRAVKTIARRYGAVDVGIVELKPYFFYSRAGRHTEDWGQAIDSHHRFAVVILVAMDSAAIKQSPSLPVIIESSHQYVEAAKIASIIAEYLRLLGGDARGHTDANYQVLCVPLAQAAGLGELGRIGILVHPVYGPCVRISVVTTDLELVPGSPKKDRRIDHFCRVCRKCADNCPSRSIPGGDEPLSRGCRHWSIDQEKCYSFWRNIGTDCAFCIWVCPYTKPDTLVHRLVRFYISRNALNQRIALFFDDLLYGRKIPLAKGNPCPPF